jgi:hypothetical protein
VALIVKRVAQGSSDVALGVRVAAASVPARQPGVPWYRRPETVAPGVAAIVVVVGYAVSIVIWSGVRAAPIRVASDSGVFALMYIAAQATERLLEPISAFVLDPEHARDQMEVALADAMNAPEDANLLQAAADAREHFEQRQRVRAFVLWAAATVVGMLASASIGLYLLAGIATDHRPPAPVDILVTGLVIGGGTKPLHDLISRIESSKQRAQQPAGTE